MGQFALHIEDYQYFESAYEDIANGSSRKQFVISYGNVNSEDPSYQSADYTSYNWINADAIEVFGTEGLLKQITVTDETIKNTQIDLSWKPKVSFDESLKKIFEAYKGDILNAAINLQD